MLYVVCCMLYDCCTVCCMLYVVCCMLYVVCCMVFGWVPYLWMCINRKKECDCLIPYLQVFDTFYIFSVNLIGINSGKYSVPVWQYEGQHSTSTVLHGWYWGRLSLKNTTLGVRFLGLSYLILSVRRGRRVFQVQ